jgi:acetyl-CoA acetyltransferase
MRDVAVVAFAQSPLVRREEQRNEVEILMPVLHQVKADTGLDQSQIDFTCSGSTDYLAGSAFSFVMTLDGVGPVPPISESHVEMDGAWALYEAWVKIQTGVADTALVYGYGKSSPGDLPMVLTRQLDPYYQAPLWPDSIAMAALQARACIESGVTSIEEMAEIAARNRRSAADNPQAYLQGSDDPAVLLKEPEIAAPLRKHDCAPITTARPRSSWPRGTGRARSPTPRRGSGGSTTASTPMASACATSRPPRRPASRPRRRASVTVRSTWPSCTPRSPTRRSWCGRLWGSATA